MTHVYCKYKNCDYNESLQCVKAVITLANNLHDGATCEDTHFVNKREEEENGKGGQAIRQEKD